MSDDHRSKVPIKIIRGSGAPARYGTPDDIRTPDEQSALTAHAFGPGWLSRDCSVCAVDTDAERLDAKGRCEKCAARFVTVELLRTDADMGRHQLRTLIRIFEDRIPAEARELLERIAASLAKAVR